MEQVLLRRPAVSGRYGKRRSALYDDIASGLFVRPVALGPRSRGWPASEVEQLVAARIAGWTDDQIRTLVARLHAARKSAADHIELST
jgi:prophage regulatory protein